VYTGICEKMEVTRRVPQVGNPWSTLFIISCCGTFYSKPHISGAGCFLLSVMTAMQLYRCLSIEMD